MPKRVFCSCANVIAHDFKIRLTEKVSGNAFVLNGDKNTPYVDKNTVSAEKKVTFVGQKLRVCGQTIFGEII